MRKNFFIFLLGIFCCANAAAENEKFFHLAGRDFTRAEAELLANGKSDLASAVQANYAAAAAIVLCGRENIGLSTEHTRRTLEQTLLLMPPEAKSKFISVLQSQNLTVEQWLDREKVRLENQLNDALRRWYIKRNGSTSPITREHIRSWYYRNMDIFRRINLDPEQLWVFAPGSETALRQAQAALLQGIPAQTVRKKYALNLAMDPVLDELHCSSVHREKLENNFIKIVTANYLILLRGNGISYTYIPLDEALQQAIGNALYDALAKAYLTEVMKKEFAGQAIVFY